MPKFCTIVSLCFAHPLSYRPNIYFLQRKAPRKGASLLYAQYEAQPITIPTYELVGVSTSPTALLFYKDDISDVILDFKSPLHGN